MTRKRQKYQTRVLVARYLLRTLLVLFTLILLLIIGAYSICNLIFNGPSPADHVHAGIQRHEMVSGDLYW